MRGDHRDAQVQSAMEPLKQKGGSESGAQSPGSPGARFIKWLAGIPGNRPRAKRHPLPGLVAYYFTGAAPEAIPVGDISATGLLLMTSNRPFVESVIRITLQRTDGSGAHLNDSITVNALVVRWASDGIGLTFIPSPPGTTSDGGAEQGTPADQKTLQSFLKRLEIPGLG